MSIRFIALADVHYDREHQEDAAKSLEAIIAAGREHKVHFFALAGDLFNRGIANTEAGGLPRLLDLIQRMLDVAPIFAVSGTPTHDLPGCYEPFASMVGEGGIERFHLLTPDNPERMYESESGEKCLVLGIPEPGKEWFLAGTNGIGRDEADKRIREGLRGILLGLGARRAEHPEINTIMLYHGMVAGASMANGQLVEGGLSIGREDLALVGAFYYALGHIHEYQQLSGIPAYYSGSAYPVNWGEVTQKRFNLVTIEPFEPAVVESIPFPHPPRKKVVMLVTDNDSPALDGIAGYQVWVVRRGTKDQIAGDPFDEGTLEALGCLPGSRVTTEIIPSETVRAAEITEKHHLREKLAVHAEASGNTLTPGVNEKADTLEREAEAAGAVEGLHIRLRKLRLRGAIGIWKGQHADEVTLDFDAYDPGLIALVGPNGAGKSTLIENCHPFPQLLTRDGTLQQHFRLRDSARELWFTDERTGAEYRALILIDGKNASGSCEYHLFRGDAPLTNGRKDDYVEKIAALFGSIELFQRSAFVAQKSTKGNPDLSEATKGEKKAMFRELAGLNYLQRYAEAAKGKADTIESGISTDRARVETLEAMTAGLENLRETRARKIVDLDERIMDREKLEEKGIALKAQADELSLKVQEQRLIKEKISGLSNQRAQKQRTISECEAAITTYQAAADGRAEHEQTVAAWTELKEREGAENERISQANAEHARLQREYNDRLRAHNADVQAVEGRKQALRTSAAAHDGNLRVFQAQIERLTADLAVPLESACPTCGQTLPEAKLGELRGKRAETERKLAEIKQKAEAEGQLKREAEQKASAIKAPEALAPLALAPINQDALQRIRGQLASLNIEDARRGLALAQEAATRIEDSRKQLDAARGNLELIESDIQVQTSRIEVGVDEEYTAALRSQAAAGGEYGEAQKAVAALDAEVKALEARLAEIDARAADAEALKAKIETAGRELAEWRYLERACGPDGIQALELDAMGPGIAEVANRMLSSAYGSRFQIEIRTTRMAGKGSKTKQVEDFSVIIHDSEQETEQELSTLSGGEAVWIKRAIGAAFGIIRDRSTGTRFLTVFGDEVDGALDPEARGRYFDMVAMEHQESGRWHTVIITHSESAQEMIPQRIDLRDLAKNGNAKQEAA